MGFIYEILEDFIQSAVAKPQFFARARKSVLRLIVHARCVNSHILAKLAITAAGLVSHQVVARL